MRRDHDRPVVLLVLVRGVHDDRLERYPRVALPQPRAGDRPPPGDLEAPHAVRVVVRAPPEGVELGVEGLGLTVTRPPATGWPKK